jgi:tetratricopeptide (TPR) repeat protein
MSTNDNRIDQLKHVPIKRDETWQGGFIRMPGWIHDDPNGPYRGVLPVWLDVGTRRAFGSALVRPKEVAPNLMLDGLVDAVFGKRGCGHLPGTLVVTDPEIATFLMEALSEVSLPITTSERLECVDEFLAAMTLELAGPLGASSPFDAEEVTLPAMRAFGAAAAAFIREAPWNHLTDMDLIRIESPDVEPELSHCVVTGAAGIARGITFFSGPDDLARFLEVGPGQIRGNRWYIEFNGLVETPFADADLWSDHKLELVDPQAYPVAFGMDRKHHVRRPDRATLTLMEGLLRTLAETSQDDMDSGRWSRTVRTSRDELTMQLALPGILDPGTDDAPAADRPLDRRSMERTIRNMGRLLEERQSESIEELNAFLMSQTVDGKLPEFEPRNAAEEALAMVDQAMEAEGRLQIKLARQALSLDPDCAEAYVLLAERMPDPILRGYYYGSAIEAAERSLGPEPFKNDVGHFWGIVETRAYMRAREGMAECHLEMGHVERALDHYRELLRLNPNDNQGIRMMILPLLLEQGHDAEAATVLDAFAEDESAPLEYTRALLAFRSEGDSPDSRAVLTRAVKSNLHLEKLLLGKLKLPVDVPDHYAFGSEDEAFLYGPGILPVWNQTPGAIEWLEQARADRRRKEKTKRKQQAASGKKGRRK